MDNIIDKNDTGQNNISQEPEWPAGLNNEGHPLPDPRLVEKLVEELKSQGKFDQIRNDCFAEVDTQVRSSNYIGSGGESNYRPSKPKKYLVLTYA